MKVLGLVAGVVGAILVLGAGMVVAQGPGPIAGTKSGTGASTPRRTGGGSSLLVSADGNYQWKLDGDDQIRLTADTHPRRVPLTLPGEHEIVVLDANGRFKYKQTIKAARGEQTVVQLTATVVQISGGLSMASGSPGASMNGPSSVGYGGRAAGGISPIGADAGIRRQNPDMFVRITPQAYPHAVAAAGAGGLRKSAAIMGYQLTIMAIPMGGTYYDIKIQAVMRGVGSSGKTVEAPDFLPGTIPSVFQAITGELGKEAVICYTARPPSQTAMRWTGTFNVQAAARPGMVAFVAAKEPTLEPASNAPCGGLSAEKEIAKPDTEVASSPGKDYRASMEASNALVRGSQLYNAKRFSEARPFLMTACDGGDSPEACNSLGFMYQNHMGVPTDNARAREYYLKSCNDDSQLSCSNLGTLYRDGLGVPQDTGQAVKLFEKGCDSGIPEGCDLAGKLLMDRTPGVTQNYPRALTLFKQACEGDLAAGCGDEAGIYGRGLGVPKDLAFAASLGTKACGMGSRNSCWDSGMRYRLGDGVPRDLVKSKEYFRQACEMGDQDSCKYAQ